MFIIKEMDKDCERAVLKYLLVVHLDAICFSVAGVGR